MSLKKKKKIKGKEHGLAYMTAEEMKAMNVLKNSPGFMGRLARVGEQMPMKESDGIPSFQSDHGGAEKYKIPRTTQIMAHPLHLAWITRYTIKVLEEMMVVVGVVVAQQ